MSTDTKATSTNSRPQLGVANHYMVKSPFGLCNAFSESRVPCRDWCAFNMARGLHSEKCHINPHQVHYTLFARTESPERLVSDNGTTFTSEEFQSFIWKNGIKHPTAVPYHPATNRLAEFKLSMNTMSNVKRWVIVPCRLCVCFVFEVFTTYIKMFMP